MRARDSSGGHALGRFLVVFFATILVGVAVKTAWLQNTDYWLRTLRLPLSLGVTNAYFESTAGPIHRDSPEGREILGILFPGYETIIDKLAPPLRERHEFSVVNVGLQDGRRVRVNIHRHLPFNLAAAAPPDILILGTSHTRDGIRPDKLATELGLGRAINASISSGSMRAHEILLRRFHEEARGRKFKLLIIEVAAVSLSHNDDVFKSWQGNIADLESSRAFPGPLKASLRAALDFLPRVESNSTRPFLYSQECTDTAVKANRLAVPASGLPPLFPGGIDRREVEAFRRVVALARATAEQVVFLEMPTTDRYKARLQGYEFETAARSVLGVDGWLRRPFQDWAIGDDDFFAAKSGGSCDLDEQHLNERGAVRFSKSLADLIRHRFAPAP